MEGFFEEIVSMCSADPSTYQYFNNLLNHRTIIMNEDVSDNIVESVIMPLLNFEADDSDEPVTLIINTVGGSVSDGLVLCNIIDNYSKKLNIVVLGYAYSMGTIILCAGAHNDNVVRSCYKFSTALLHGGETSISGSSGQAKDNWQFVQKLEEIIKHYVLSQTSITEEEYNASERHEMYLTSEQMLEKGLVDKIL